MWIQEEESRELRRLYKQRNEEPKCRGPFQAPAKPTAKDEAKRHEEAYVRHYLRDGRDPVLLQVTHKPQGVQLRRDAVADAQSGVSRRKGEKREAHERQRVEDREVGPRRRPKVQATVAVIQEGQDGHGQDERGEGPEAQRGREAARVAHEETHGCTSLRCRGGQGARRRSQGRWCPGARSLHTMFHLVRWGCHRYGLPLPYAFASMGRQKDVDSLNFKLDTTDQGVANHLPGSKRRGP